MRLTLLIFMLGGLLMADTPKVYFRVHLEQTDPEGQPVRIGVSVFESFRFFPWITFGKFGIGKKSGKIPFSTEFRALLPWDEIQGEEQFRAGETTPWIDITKELAVAKGDSPAHPPETKTLCVAFQSPLLPAVHGEAPSPNPMRRGFKGDGGNLRSVSAVLEFASAPDEKAIVKRLDITTDLSVIPIVFSGVLDEKLQLKPPQDFTGIRHINDTLRDELAFLEKNTPQAVPLKHCVSSSWIHHGYHFNLYDSGAEKIRMESLRHMGFNYINWYITPPRGKAPEGLSFQFIEFPTGPEWLLKSPFIPVDRKQALGKIQEILDRWMTEYKIDRGREVYCRVGDEIKLLSEDLLYSDPACPAAFREFLKKRGVKVLGTERPVTRDEIRNAEDAKLYYYSTVFRQEKTLEFWLVYMKLLREAFGKTPVRFGMESCGISFDAWPDYHAMSEAHLMDFFIHEYTTKLWVPHHYGIAIAAKHASAAKFGKEEAGGLFCASRTGTETGNDLLGITALGRGFRHAFFYGSFPDDPKLRRVVQCSIARFNSRFSLLEDLILDGCSSANSGTVAVGISPASELWRGSHWSDNVSPTLARGVLAERNLLMASLAMNQLPFDYLPEALMKDHLKDYTVLVLPDPNLSENAQNIVAEWVRNGGHLITIAGSTALNEFNQPASLGQKLSGAFLDNVAGGRDKAYGEYAKELYDFPSVGNILLNGKKTNCVVVREELKEKDGKVLVRWENNRPGVVSYPVGKGVWTHIGFLPGASMARSAKTAFLQSLVHRNKPALQHDQCEFAPELLTFYPSLMPEEMAARRIWTDRPGVEATLWEKKDRAAILLADYGSGVEKKVRVFLRSKVPWTECRSEKGELIQVRTENGVSVMEIPLASTRLLLLSGSDVK